MHTNLARMGLDLVQSSELILTFRNVKKTYFDRSSGLERHVSSNFDCLWGCGSVEPSNAGSLISLKSFVWEITRGSDPIHSTGCTELINLYVVQKLDT